jgi:branched-chain amino acid transport system ATP-binding protein
VEENVTAVASPGPWSVKHVYEMFPQLQERRFNMGNPLSGGEQRMVVFARALVLNPRRLDQPLEGLAPITVDELLLSSARVVREEGLSDVLVEQNPRLTLSMTHQAVLLDCGRVMHCADSKALASDPHTLERLLPVAR